MPGREESDLIERSVSLEISMGYNGNVGSSIEPTRNIKPIRSMPLIGGLEANPTILSINQENSISPNQLDTRKNSSPTRFAPSIIDLGIAAATLISIYSLRYFVKKIKQNKEIEKKEESKLEVKDIATKLSSIFDENVVFDEVNLTIKFNNFSPIFYEKVKNFFTEKGLKDNVSFSVNKGLTLKRLDSINLDKNKYIFDEFLQTFDNDLHQEKQEIALRKQEEAEIARQQKLINNLLSSIDTVNDKIQEIIELNEAKKNSESKRRKKSNPQEELEKENKEKQKYSQLIEQKKALMESFKEQKDKIPHMEEHYKSFFEIKFKKFDALIKDLSLFIDKDLSKTVSFQAVRLYDQEKVTKEIIEKVDDEDLILTPIPAPVVEKAEARNQNLTASDLIALKALFLEEGFTKIYYKKDKKQAFETLDIENLKFGFLNKENLESRKFIQEFKSDKNKESLREFRKVENNENLAKHYFHNLLVEVVDDIFVNRNPNGLERRRIKDSVYGFLNYAMGDKVATLEDYRKREIEGERLGSLTGLGHASGASLKNIEKLCHCLKMFKNNGVLRNVDSDKLEKFIGLQFFSKEPLRESDSLDSYEVFYNPIEKKPDNIFAQDLILQLTDDELKPLGYKEFEQKILEFFQKNAQKILENLNQKTGISIEYSQKISQVYATTEFEGNTLKYLSENLDIVSDIVVFAQGKPLSLPMENAEISYILSDSSHSLKDDLKSVYDEVDLRLINQELRKGHVK